MRLVLFLAHASDCKPPTDRPTPACSRTLLTQPDHLLVGFQIIGFDRRYVLLHILGGMVALLAGPIQLWLGISDRGMRVHRRLGLVYVASVGFSCVGALYLAFHSDLGWVFSSGLVGLATAWIITTGLAFIAIRRQLYDQHKEWMIRSYVVTFGFVTFRALQVGLAAAHAGTLGEQLAVASWYCWAVPLMVTEAILQGRKILAVGRML